MTTPSADYERLRAILMTTARHAPTMLLADAVDAILEVEAELTASATPRSGTPVITSLRELADFALACPPVAEYMNPYTAPGVQKIQAIKELRSEVARQCDATTAAAWGGLKMCKDAVEAAWPTL